MSNTVISLAIIGKNNEPLYLREFVDRKTGQRRDLVDEAELFGLAPSALGEDTGAEPEQEQSTVDTGSSDEDDDSGIGDTIPSFRSVPVSLKQEFLLHAAVDRFEQLSGPPPGLAWRRNTNTAQTNDSNPMYMGLLYPVEDLRVYAYCTTTQIKFFCVVVDDPHNSSQDATSGVGPTDSAGRPQSPPPPPQSMRRPTSPLSPSKMLLQDRRGAATATYPDTDSVLQTLFESLHQCYVSHTLNPFSPLIMTSSSISSKRFDDMIEAAVTKHNQQCLARS